MRVKEQASRQARRPESAPAGEQASRQARRPESAPAEEQASRQARRPESAPAGEQASRQARRPESAPAGGEQASRQARRPESAPAGGGGLREQKRTATQQRIAEAAARLATAQGIAATTVDEIAAAAGVGRATFFRYFDSKELAIAHGLSGAGAYVLAAIIADVPAALGPLDAVRAAQAVLGEHFAQQRAMFLEQAELSRSSPAMFAWTLHLYGEWEVAIADAVAPRFRDLEPGDPRPRMIGAMTMAAARLACDVWVDGGGTGDLPALIQQHLAALDVAG